MLYGKKLKFGDTVGLIAPSGAVRTPGAIERAVAETERMGFKVKLGESCGARYGYLSGSDEIRARDVNTMFLDDEVDAIICLRGGYGTMRILDQLDYGAIAAHPKIFVGFSDITAMHIAMLQRCNLVTFHGPMAASNWSDKPLDDFSRTSMYRALMHAEPVGELLNPPEYSKATVNPGQAEGQLVGGNLTLIAASLGTPWELDTTDRIIFIEDIGERTYCLDRMLTQMRLAGMFDRCAGVVFGDFADCPIEYPEFGCTLEEIINDVVKPCGKPIFTGLRCGHCSPKLTLPFGVRCRMDADNCTLTVLESAVTE
ncbi:MAG: LD-carboxypeptidase [Clostridia bacterium]|nr:LD-carboxypeptidase [Clostridia bacterium]